MPAFATILQIAPGQYVWPIRNRYRPAPSRVTDPLVDLPMPDARSPGLVRLEYRNVTMRLAEARGRGVPPAIRGVIFAVADGEVVSLIGPSGCGKSTLLNIGSGLVAPSEGIALVDGEEVEGPNAQVAFMLQKDLLLPWRTV